MSHKSGSVIINAIMPPNGQPVASLTSEQCSCLNEMRTRDEYNKVDCIRLAAIVGLIADEPAD